MEQAHDAWPHDGSGAHVDDEPRCPACNRAISEHEDGVAPGAFNLGIHYTEDCSTLRDAAPYVEDWIGPPLRSRGRVRVRLTGARRLRFEHPEDVEDD